MKKRLTVSTLAGNNIKARKKQYALMIIGIILAMIFSTGATFLTSSIISGVKDLSQRAVGREDLIFFGIGDETLSEALDEGYIANYSEGENIGFIIPDGKGKGTAVAKLSDKARDMTYTVVLEGKYPEKAGEIALENDLYLSLKTDAKIGDKITVKYKTQSGNDYLDETEKTFTLTGILHDRRKNITENDYCSDFMPAAFVSAEEEIDLGGKSQRIVFAEKKVKKLTNEFYEFCQSRADLQDGDINYISHYPPSSAHTLMENGALMVVLAVVMMLASCIGIVNSFNSNLLERKKQIGLLRAIGTTRKQIIDIFGREALIIALICTPISILISFFGTKLIVSLIGNGMIFIPNFAVLFIGAFVSVACVMAASLIVLVTASRISPMQAVRNVKMIRQIRRKKIKQQTKFNVALITAKRNLSFSRGRNAAISIMLTITLLLSSFGISLLIHEFDESMYKTNHDYFVSTGSGCSSTYFNSFHKNSNRFVTNNDIGEILYNPYVKEVSCYDERRIIIRPRQYSKFLDLYSTSEIMFSFENKNTEPDINKDNYKKFIEENNSYDATYSKKVRNKLGLNDDIVGVGIISVPANKLSDLKDKVIEGKIDINKLNSGKEIILARPKEEMELRATIYQYNFGTDVDFSLTKKSSPLFNKNQKDIKVKTVVLDSAKPEFHVGDEIDLSLIDDYYTDREGPTEESELTDYDRFDKTVKIGAIVESGIGFENAIHLSGNLGFVTTNQGLESFGTKHKYSQFTVTLKGKCNDEIDESVMGTLDTVMAGVDNVYVHSEYQFEKDNENTAKVLITGLASIILLLFAVCTNLINNSLTARIRENKREIGTLRAVGATVTELTKSYIYQLIYMLSIGMTCGLGIFFSTFVGVKIFEKVTKQEVMMTFRFEIPILICIAIFAVCAVNLYAQIKKMTRTSIIDNIREL